MTVIESIHGSGNRRMVFYRHRDVLGVWRPYGPITAAGSFDATAYIPTVEAKMLEMLASEEFERLVK